MPVRPQSTNRVRVTVGVLSLICVGVLLVESLLALNIRHSGNADGAKENPHAKKLEVMFTLVPFHRPGCIAWRTATCMKVGNRSHWGNIKGTKGCDAEIPEGSSGFCDCERKGRKLNSGCEGFQPTAVAATCRSICDADCKGWRQTGNCDATGGHLEPSHDKFCNETIPNGSSGLCECGSNKITFGCSHRPFTCEIICAYQGGADMFRNLPILHNIKPRRQRSTSLHRSTSTPDPKPAGSQEDVDDYQSSPAAINVDKSVLIQLDEPNPLHGNIGKAAHEAADPKSLAKREEIINRSLNST